MGNSSVKKYAKVMASLRDGQAKLHEEAADVVDCGRESAMARYAMLDEAYTQYIAGRSAALHGGVALDVAAMIERESELDRDRQQLQGKVERAMAAVRSKRLAAKETKRSAKKLTKAAL
jgi:hypothetical protein